MAPIMTRISQTFVGMVVESVAIVVVVDVISGSELDFSRPEIFERILSIDWH